jgi:hypothetical protein
LACHPNANPLIRNVPNKILFDDDDDDEAKDPEDLDDPFNPTTIVPSLSIKYSSFYLSALESFKPREKKMKVRKMLIFLLLFVGHIYVNFLYYFYSICYNEICFCCLYASLQAIKLLIAMYFGHFSVVGP